MAVIPSALARFPSRVGVLIENALDVLDEHGAEP